MLVWAESWGNWNDVKYTTKFQDVVEKQFDHANLIKKQIYNPLD